MWADLSTIRFIPRDMVYVQIDVMLLLMLLISAFVFRDGSSPKSRLKLSCVMVVPMKAESEAC